MSGRNLDRFAPLRRRPAWGRGEWGAAMLVGLGLLLCGCAERETAPKIEAHTRAWNEPGSVDFHGLRVAIPVAPDPCKTCHGEDLRGEADVVGCYGCHAGPGGHPGGYVGTTGELFHGDDVAHMGPGPCTTCHGEDHRGGWSMSSCYTCHAGGPSGHPDGWMEASSTTFHGAEVYRNGDTDCRRCHGTSLGGGTSGVACADCHG